MKALITGASYGMGADMARILSEQGYEIILVARNEEKLQTLAKELENARYYVADLSNEEECFKLYETYKNENIEILINNAGFGVFGPFDQTDLQSELNMLNLNIKAVHILTKLFYQDFYKKNSGYIMNVSSSAAFLPGPLFSSYYASKTYVLNLTMALHEELRQENKNVVVSAFCPGPVKTKFNQRAEANFAASGLESMVASAYAIEQMFKKKLVVVPGAKMKVVRFLQRFASDKLLLKITYRIQKRRLENK